MNDYRVIKTSENKYSDIFLFTTELNVQNFVKLKINVTIELVFLHNLTLQDYLENGKSIDPFLFLIKHASY